MNLIPETSSPSVCRPGKSRWLTALPVFNEVNYVDGVLDQVLQHADRVLVVNDGSTDGTREKLDARAAQSISDDRQLSVVHHQANRGYGAALQTAFAIAIEHDFEGVVTLDCDGQHQPHRIPRFIQAASWNGSGLNGSGLNGLSSNGSGSAADIVSGSRYLKKYDGDDEPPAERMSINRRITADLNERLGYELTDAFCGFKAYRTDALRRLAITDDGYAMPLQLWVQAAAAGLRVIELPVPLIYLDLERSFGGSLDHAETRLKYYNRVLQDAIDALTDVQRESLAQPKRAGA